MLEIALGIPSNLKWFSASYTPGKVRMGNLLDPAFVGLVESARFNSVDPAVDRKEPVLKRFAAFAFFWQTWGLDFPEGSREPLFANAEGKESSDEESKKEGQGQGGGEEQGTVAPRLPSIGGGLASLNLRNNLIIKYWN